MVLLFHIVIATVSVAHATYLFMRPYRPQFHIAYTLLAGTVLSGTYLVIILNAHLIRACLTGLLYLGAVSTLLILARRRLSPSLKTLNREQD